MKTEEIANWFTYHAPTPEQQIIYMQLRGGALDFANIINELVPDCADKTAAIRKLRECVMTANAAVACSAEPLPPNNDGIIYIPLTKEERMLIDAGMAEGIEQADSAAATEENKAVRTAFLNLKRKMAL